MRKIKVGVLMGGPSTEHNVSINTGRNVLKFLDKSKFDATPIILTKKFKINSKIINSFKSYNLIFNALHGSFGEDGTIQRILNKSKIRYTGSGVKASSIAMNKWSSYIQFLKYKINTPKTYKIKNYNNLMYPVILKPKNGGSSVGIRIIKSKEELNGIENKNDYLIQEYVKGKEFTCGILEINIKTIALPVVQIIPKEKYEFFDYRAKYRKGESNEIVPALISKKLTKRLQNLAIKTHKSFGCSSYSRTDFIVKDNKIYVLEINTLPGLTSNSLLPKEAKAIGICFKELLTTICESSLKQF